MMREAKLDIADWGPLSAVVSGSSMSVLRCNDYPLAAA
jgi:hypothetical protein